MRDKDTQKQIYSVRFDNDEIEETYNESQIKVLRTNYKKMKRNDNLIA